MVLLVLALCRPLKAQDPNAPRLSLRDAVERALAHHPTLGASRARREAADAAVAEASATRWPTLSVSGSATQFQQPMIVYPIHAFTPNETPPFDETLFQATAEGSYTLFDGGARGARIRVAGSRAAAAEASLSEAQIALVESVAAAYLQILSRQEVLEAQAEALAALAAELARVRRLFEVGRAAAVEILRVEAAIASSEAEQARLAASLDLAERDLARLTGEPLPGVRAARLVGVSLVDPTLPSREPAVNKAREASPTLRMAEEELQAAQAEVALARSAGLPGLKVVGRYVDWGSASGENALEWNVGLQVSYPVFTGGAVASAVARAEANARGAAERRRLVAAEVLREIDRAYAALEPAEARLRSLAIALARFEEVSRIEKLRLDAGAGTQVDYLKAEADLRAARAARIEAGYDRIRARVELARATGELSPAWLDAYLRNER
jgi:outer membrane protein TolC